MSTEPEILRKERRALEWAALLALLAIAWIFAPVGVGILLGMLLAFTTQPLYEKLFSRFGRERAALAVVVASATALLGTVTGLVWLLVDQGTSLASKLSEAVGPGGLANEGLAWAEEMLGRFGITPGELTRRARSLAGEAAKRSAGAAETVLGTFGTALLGLFFAMLTMHYILRHWDALTSRAQQTLPLRPEYTRALFAEFRRVGRETLLGTVVTGLAQGAIATIGYFITGVPQPIFFGAATALASLVPAVGTLLVWVPVGIVLIVLGHPARGAIELAWGAILTVGVSDYVIRPRLVGGGEEIPSLVTFAALFGGVEVFGLKGLILGPVVVSLAIAVLRLYSDEMREQRART